MKPDEHITPNESPSIQKLFARAAADGVDTNILWDILWLITADCHLLAFTTAASRLVNILDHIPPSWDSAEAEADIESWRPVLEWVIQKENSLTVDIGEHFSRKVNTAKSNPMLGSRSSQFPHYTVLCEILPPGAVGDNFILLSAQLLIAHVVALREHSTVDEYRMRGKSRDWKFLRNGVAPAALSVRRLSETPYRSYLSELSPEQPPEDFAEELLDSDPPVDPVMRTDRISLGRFLQKVWGMLDWRERGGGGGGSDGGHKWVGGRLEGPRLSIERLPDGADDDPATDWGSIDIVKFTNLSTKKKNRLLKIDLSPDENEDDQDVLLSDFDCSTTKQDPGALGRAARTKVRFMSRSNQVLPWDYGALSKQEITNLHRTLDQELRSVALTTDWTALQLLTAESLLALEIMLWTGSDLQRVVQTQTCFEAPSSQESDMAVVIPRDGIISNIRWRIKALRPDYKTEISSTPSHIRPQSGTYDLPDLANLAPLIDNLLARQPKSKGHRALFQNEEAAISEHIKKWLKQRFPDGRITANKIQWALWLRVHQNTGDPAIASCVTGTAHPLARVRLHYTSPWVKDIQNHYIKAANSLVTRQGEARPSAFSTPSWMETAQASSVGARQCPTLRAVRSMFTQLKTDIARAEDHLDLAGFIEYHNLLTLYSIQFFAYSTTCRAIVTPYLPLDSIDASTGLASLSDKDDESCHKTRLVWVPEPLRRQMASYEAHLNQQKVSHFHLPSALLPEPCLFLDADNQLSLVRPKLIEPLLKRYLDVKVNTHRRFLRTELIERDCPPEIVDAFMGHWYAGEEPFGVFSSFNFDQYARVLCHYLIPLLEEIGLTPSQSRADLCRER